MNISKDPDATPADDRLKRFKELLVARERIPFSTYRLQLNQGFTFREARSIVSYLSQLGISHCYTSPFLTAGKGSQHGYDISSYAQINPELGGEEQYQELIAELSRHHMGHVLDFVPNHMGIASSENQWWQDVLENGRCSPYAKFFDIDWNPAKVELKGKILLPVLGDQYGVILDQGDLVLHMEEGAFFLKYYEHRLPIDPQSTPIFLSHHLDPLQKELPESDLHLLEFLSIITALNHLPSTAETTPEKIEVRLREKEVNRNRLLRLLNESPRIQQHIRDNLKIFNGTPGQPESFDLLHRLLENQVYRLSNWRTAVHEINYRRFFDINHLAGIRMELPEVFEQTHSFILHLIGEGTISGLRLDHPDGLFDPAAYFDELQEAVLHEYLKREEQFSQLDPEALKDMLQAWRQTEMTEDPSGSICRPLYVVVEKILTGAESLPEDWTVHGTSGYDFMNDLNGLFVNSANEKEFSKVYSRFTGITDPFSEIVYASKKLIMQTALTSELNVLVRALNLISEHDRYYRDFTLNSLREALREVVAYFPLYRTYIDWERSKPEDRETFGKTIARAKSANPAMESSIFEFIQNTILLDTECPLSEEHHHSRRDFIMKLQQFTAPVQAKGLEDTAFYRYNRLLSLNEVGGQPQRFGLSTAAFHARNQKRQKVWPFAMTATATHDHKRGEDVRARLNVLAEIPDEWRKAIRRWSMLNRSKRTPIQEEFAPDRNDEYLFYQTLVGMWPAGPADEVSLETVKTRLTDYMLKATKEAKVRTSWINPNQEYDAAIIKFICKTLKPSKSNRFLDSFLSFQERIAKVGAINSLAQVAIKLTAPGIPDTYQGCELWDLSLVDPDNRRPVDYELRRKYLQELEPLLAIPSNMDPGKRAASLHDLLDHWQDGRIKLFITACGLRLRKNRPHLFLEGDYISLQVEGERADHVVAFARQHKGKTVVTVTPRLAATLMQPDLNWPVDSIWENTKIILPQGLADRDHFQDLFTRNRIPIIEEEGQACLYLKTALSLWPLALLVEEIPAGA